MESEEVIPHDLPRISRKTLVIVAVIACLIFAGAFFIGWWPRHQRIAQRQEMARDIADQKLVVQVAMPKPTGTTFELTLPADVRPFAATALYARITGFLDHWTVDINDRVKQGDLLAVITAPDTDADLNQAKANLDQANANVNQQRTNYELAQVTYKRYEGLKATGGVTQQQLDQYNSAMVQAQASLNAAQATVKSTQASVDRIAALQGFEKIFAPFDGVITARNYDRGALINASNTAAGQELFDIARDDKLRVFVNVPQSYSTLIKFDQPVFLNVRNYPGHDFPGNIARSSAVLDPSTRTLRTELDFNNADHLLFAGMYGQARFKITREHPLLTVPTSALLFEDNGTQVAVVRDNDKVHFQKITVGRDLGTEIEVDDGLKGSERVVANPGEKLAEGLQVSIANSDGESAPQQPARSVTSASTEPSGKVIRVAGGTSDQK